MRWENPEQNDYSRANIVTLFRVFAVGVVSVLCLLHRKANGRRLFYIADAATRLRGYAIRCGNQITKFWSRANATRHAALCGKLVAGDSGGG